MSARNSDQRPEYDRIQQFSDLTLSVGENGQIFKVHKFVVCSQSEMLMTACSGRFIEAQTNRIELPEDRPDIISLVLDYLYLKEYDDCAVPALSASIVDATKIGRNMSPKARSQAKVKRTLPLPLAIITQYAADDQTRLDTNVRVYTCSLRLGIPTLCDHSFAKIECNEPFILACLVLPSTLEHIYRNTLSDDRLRRLITDSCVQYHECLIDPFLRHNPKGDDVVHVLNEFEPMAWYIGVAAWRKIRAQEEALLRQNFELMTLKHKDFGVWQKPSTKKQESDVLQEEDVNCSSSDGDLWFDCGG